MNKDISSMTSDQLKQRFMDYQYLYNIIYETNNKTKMNNPEEEQFKKRNQEMQMENFIQKDEEKAKIENIDNNVIEQKVDEQNLKESKDKENNELKDIGNNEENKEEHKDDDENKNEKKEDDNSLDVEKNSQGKIFNDSSKGLIDEELKDDSNKKNENEIKYYTEETNKLNSLYNKYIESFNQEEKQVINFEDDINKYLKGLYPKIIIASNPQNSEEICGLCAVNYIIDSNNDLILNINHISSKDSDNKNIKEFINLIEKDFSYKFLEVKVKGKNTLYEALFNLGFKDYSNSQEEQITLRKESNKEKNSENYPQINYDSLSIFSLKDKNTKDINSTKYSKFFENIINEINYGLLLNVLKQRNIYEITITPELSTIDKISKIQNLNFDFIKYKNNNCLDIQKMTDNQISKEDNTIYPILNNNISFTLNISTSIKIDNKFLYNCIEVNPQASIIKEKKYMNNLLYIPTSNKNIFVIIYQYNAQFEKDFFDNNKCNIYSQFISFFKDDIKYFKMENSSNEEKIKIWIPAFDINTHLFTYKLKNIKNISVKNNNEEEKNIEKFDEIVKCNFKPDPLWEKSVKSYVDNNDIVIKDKFLFGIFHKEFMDATDIPIISLFNVTKENFIS